MTTLREYQEALADLAEFASPAEMLAEQTKKRTKKARKGNKYLEGAASQAGYVASRAKRGAQKMYRGAKRLATQEAQDLVKAGKIARSGRVGKALEELSKTRLCRTGLIGTGALGAAALLSRRRKKDKR